ncbi:copper chaperone PCu(A)C [Streptomyces apocyni]|uniref:copper chaperone PCu(A)C n=1 Tax=Streptomyces apocyni TaxID=2654677 RepID=UPI0012E9B3B4|nr:copper chaperone PCu(A)C [Streptomyces apocyni]
MSRRHGAGARALIAAIAVASGLALAGCSDDSTKPELKVSGGFVPKPAMPDMASGFFTVTNSGAEADELTSVTSDVGEVTMHTTKNQAMKAVSSFDVPANGELKLERGGNHLMLEKLKRTPKLGEKVSVELHFAKSGTVKAELDVKAANHNPKTEAQTKNKTETQPHSHTHTE